MPIPFGFWLNSWTQIVEGFHHHLAVIIMHPGIAIRAEPGNKQNMRMFRLHLRQRPDSFWESLVRVNGEVRSSRAGISPTDTSCLAGGLPARTSGKADRWDAFDSDRVNRDS